MRFIWFLVPGLSRASVDCPLDVSRMDGLVTVPVVQSDGSEVHLIIDTGAAGAVFFDPTSGESTESAIAFQQAKIGQVKPHRQAALSCSPQLLLSSPVSGRPEPADLMQVADGILGLGGRGFSNPSLLYSPEAPKWTTVSITMPSGLTRSGSGSKPGALKIYSRTLRRSVGASVPVISDYYWAAGADGLKIGDHVIPHAPSLAAIFDTGSNYFGASRGVIEKITEAVRRNGCKDPLVLQLTKPDSKEPMHLKFGPEDYTLGGSCDDLAIEPIEKSQLGDLSHRDLVIVGTRGLRSRTISIYRPSSSKQGPLMLSLEGLN